MCISECTYIEKTFWWLKSPLPCYGIIFSNDTRSSSQHPTLSSVEKDPVMDTQWWHTHSAYNSSKNCQEVLYHQYVEMFLLELAGTSCSAVQLKNKQHGQISWLCWNECQEAGTKITESFLGRNNAHHIRGIKHVSHTIPKATFEILHCNLLYRSHLNRHMIILLALLYISIQTI